MNLFSGKLYCDHYISRIKAQNKIQYTIQNRQFGVVAEQCVSNWMNFAISRIQALALEWSCS